MVDGDLSMTKPDYNQMTRKELKEYLKVNRQDNEAWTVFFEKLSQLDPERSYPPPYTMSKEEVEDIFRSRLQKDS
jgi:hypothetical protein